MILLLSAPTPSRSWLCLVDSPDMPVESAHRGELVVAVVTRGVAGVVLLVTGEGLRVMEHLGADITDIFCWVTVLETKPYNMVKHRFLDSLYFSINQSSVQVIIMIIHFIIRITSITQ